MTRKDINLIEDAYASGRSRAFFSDPTGSIADPKRRPRAQLIGYIIIEPAGTGGLRAGDSNESGDMIEQIFYAKRGTQLKLQANPSLHDGVNLDDSIVKDDENTLIISPLDPRTNTFGARIGSATFKSNNNHIHIKVVSDEQEKVKYIRAR
jgi:hypothetical protein